MCFCSNDLCNGKNKLDTKECSITESLESSPVRLHREQLAHELHPKCYCQCYDQNHKHNMHLIEYILIDIFFLFLHSIFRVHKFKWVYNEWKKKIRRKMLFFHIDDKSGTRFCSCIFRNQANILFDFVTIWKYSLSSG